MAYLVSMPSATPRRLDTPTDRSLSTIEDVNAAVSKSSAAQPAWARQPLDDRIAALKDSAILMLKKRREVLTIIREETGKHAIDALLSEVVAPLDQVNQWAQICRHCLGRKRMPVSRIKFPRKKAFAELVPRGVVGVITPWNYPLGVFYRPVFPALMTGNAVVVKPSEYAPRTAGWFCEQLQQALPDGVLQVVNGDWRTGEALIDAGIDACSFTGSVASGREVLKRCAARLIPANCELGGKDAAIVLADCDLDRTLAGITYWALHNVGQNCGAIKRIYIEDTIADVFVTRLAAAWAQLRVEPEEIVDVSPLGTAAQLDVMRRHIADAKAKGATVVCGGDACGDGLSFRPTVLDHCTRDMAVVAEETFGPVVAVVRVEDADEGVRAANDSKYGLGASIWTNNFDKGHELADRLDVGVASINNHGITGAMVCVPWTGTKMTGTGVANSHHALSFFCRPRTYLVDNGRGPDPFWLPYDLNLYDLGNRLADVQLMKLWRAFKIPVLLRRRLERIRAFYASQRGRG